MLCGRAVGQGDPLWTQDDTDLAVALTEAESERHSCGHPRTVSMDPAHEFDWAAEAVRCHACDAIERASRSAAQSDTWDDAGIGWYVTKRRDDDGGI